MKAVLTIAGSDSSGGAGIQADIKTMTANGVYAMSAITALTAQNTLGVSAIHEVDADFLVSQLDSVFTDIRPDAVKTGMIPSAQLVENVAERLVFYKAANIVVDPVMVATSGSRLMKNSALESLCTRLLTIATVVTPNIPEATAISGIEISNSDSMLRAAKMIHDSYGCAVLLKGGHSIENADDIFYDGEAKWLFARRIDNPNTHGTGCTLSSAIASNLAKGYMLLEAVRRAKEYISGSLSAMLDIGKGSGPLNHCFDISSRFF